MLPVEFAKFQNLTSSFACSVFACCQNHGRELWNLTVRTKDEENLNAVDHKSKGGDVWVNYIFCSAAQNKWSSGSALRSAFPLSVIMRLINLSFINPVS